MEALYLIIGLLCGLPIGWSLRSPVRDITRDLTNMHKRLDSTAYSLQREAQERGRISRRLAQAETKIARLLKPKPTPTGDHQ